MSRVFAVMPAYNQAQFIEEAVNSAIDQVDLLVIVDDGSTDNTKNYLQSLHYEDKVLVLTSTKNMKPIKAINAGVAYFGEPDSDTWWTWLSSDNIMMPDWRDRLLAAGKQHNAGAVYSGYTRFFDGRGAKRAKDNYHYEDPGQLIGGSIIFPGGPSFLIRSDIWASTGPHKRDMAHDLDHWLRVEAACALAGRRVVGVNESLCRYRDHPKRRVLVEGSEDIQPILADARKQRIEIQRALGKQETINRLGYALIP